MNRGRAAFAAMALLAGMPMGHPEAPRIPGFDAPKEPRPLTDADRAALARAEEKRARKAARRGKP